MATNGAAVKASDGGGSIVSTFGIVVLAVCLGFGFAFLPRIMRASGGGGSKMVGQEAPQFAALDVVANDKSLANAGAAAGKKSVALSDLRGHAVILDFWATWCGPCQAQSPVLDGIAHRYADRGLVVLGINTMDGPGKAERWALGHGISYPILFDGEQEAAHVYGVESLPTIVVLDKEGKVRAVRVGFTDQGEIESLLRQVM